MRIVPSPPDSGQLAGTHHGEEGIPAEWSARLALRATTEGFADRLHAAAGAGPA